MHFLPLLVFACTIVQWCEATEIDKHQASIDESSAENIVDSEYDSETDTDSAVSVESQNSLMERAKVADAKLLLALKEASNNYDFFDVVIPLDLDKAEEILMRYSPKQWENMAVRVVPFNVPGQTGTNMQIFLRIFVDLILKSNTVFQPTPSGRFFEFRHVSQTSLNKAQFLKRCNFVGRLFALASLGHPIDLPIPLAFYSLLLNGDSGAITVHDVKSIDQRSFYHLNGLYNLIADPDISFSVPFRTIDFPHIINGRTISLSHNLHENGSSEPLTRDNVQQYVFSYCTWVVYRKANQQVTAFLDGFLSVFPRKQLQIYISALPEYIYRRNSEKFKPTKWPEYDRIRHDVFKMEQIIQGKRDLPINEWRAFTEYEGYLGSDPQIESFWDWVVGLKPHKQRTLLLHTTRSTHRPVPTFENLKDANDQPRKFCIVRGDRLDWDKANNILVLPRDAGPRLYQKLLRYDNPKEMRKLERM